MLKIYTTLGEGHKRCSPTNYLGMICIVGASVATKTPFPPK